MWKRNDPAESASLTPTPPDPAPGSAPSEPPAAPLSVVSRGTATIGQSVVIKGELAASEDLTTEGRIEGKIALQQHLVTIGQNATVRAQVFAREVIVLGHVVGNITATEKVDIRENGKVEGDIVSPTVAIADGAHFRGSIDMQRGAAETGTATSKETAAPAMPLTSKSSEAKRSLQPAARSTKIPTRPQVTHA